MTPETPSRGPMTPTMYRVTERSAEVEQTTTLVIEPIGDSLAAPLPGQFTMLWAFGVGEAPISVAATKESGALVQTIRAVGAVTAALCALKPGDEVGVRGPYGSAWPINDAEGDDVLVVAGGLGLAPVRSIISEVLVHRSRFGRCTLLLGARNPQSLIYIDELNRWTKNDRIDVQIIVDTAGRHWTGQVGLVTKLITNAAIDATRTHAFVCGPEPMMRFSCMAVADQGVPADRIWLSLERNMHCAVVQCGHCQLGPLFLCRDGPVVAWPTVDGLLRIHDR